MSLTPQTLIILRNIDRRRIDKRDIKADILELFASDANQLSSFKCACPMAYIACIRDTLNFCVVPYKYTEFYTNIDVARYIYSFGEVAVDHHNIQNNDMLYNTLALIFIYTYLDNIAKEGYRYNIIMKLYNSLVLIREAYAGSWLTYIPYIHWLYDVLSYPRLIERTSCTRFV